MRIHGCGSKRKPLETTGFDLFVILPIEFFRYPSFDPKPHLSFGNSILYVVFPNYFLNVFFIV